MKRLIGLLLLGALIFGGYTLYTQSKSASQSNKVGIKTQNLLTVEGAADEIGQIASILGASIESTYINGKEMLSSATSGASDPIINQLVEKTTETLKDLPQKQAEKIMYEFCRGIVEDYENKSSSKDNP